MLEKDLNHEIINDNEVIQQLKEADHFYICHYSKKNERIEHRRVFGTRNLKFGKQAKAS